jgi:hypothetical protein
MGDIVKVYGLLKLRYLPQGDSKAWATRGATRCFVDVRETPLGRRDAGAVSRGLRGQGSVNTRSTTWRGCRRQSGRSRPSISWPRIRADETPGDRGGRRDAYLGWDAGVRDALL